MWSITIYFILLFYYTSGQIIQVPADEHDAKLKLMKRDPVGRILPLEAKIPVRRLPSQWEKDSDVASRWPNARIPFYIDTNSYDSNIRTLLQNFALIHISNNNECPTFEELKEKPRYSDGSWLHFTNPDRVRECVHEPGRETLGEIVVVFGYDCLKPAQILHTLLHGLGFRDEVTHPQRDLFVKVMWENIQPAFRSMFRIQSVGSGALLDYDPKSIMHFHDRAFSLNGQATIAPMLPGLRIEPADGLSHLDKMKIRLTFGHECKKRQIGTILNSCGRYDGFTNKSDTEVIPGKDIVVLPENDGKREDDTEPEVTPSDGDVDVIPGKDVNIETDTENDVPSGNDGSPSNGDVDVIPGKDVNIDTDTENEVDVVIPGKDVKIETDTENEVPSGNDGSPSNGDVDVIPGKDVNIETDTENEVPSGNDKSPSTGDVDVIPGKDVNIDIDTENEVDVVIPGKDVNPETDAENEVPSGNDEFSSGANSYTGSFVKHELPSGENVMIISNGTVNITNGEVWAEDGSVTIRPVRKTNRIDRKKGRRSKIKQRVE